MPKQKRVITEYRHYELPLNFPVLLLSGERWRISDKRSGRLHFHNCLEIGICHTDSGVMEINGKSLPFKAGDVTCIPRNLPHTTYSNQGKESLWSYIFVDPEELFRGFLPEPALFDLTMGKVENFRHLMNKADFPKVYFLVTTIIDELEIQHTNYQTSVRALLTALCVELMRIQEAEDMKCEMISAENALVISPALDYIYNNYNKQFPIEVLSDLCHLSVTHFRRLFHSIIGTSPLDFINNTRINKACILLRSTEDSVLSISEQVGFHSISSFNRYFARIMGVSPREWRNQVQLSDAKVEKQSVLELSGWQ